MDCRDALERMSEYQDGAPDSAEAVGAHLRECAGCAEAARSLATVREGLRRLPPVAAPPELMARVREAVAREGGGPVPGSAGAAAPPGAGSVLSRLRLPLEAAAAVLLVASIYWYQKGALTPSVPQAPPAPTGTAAPAPKAATDSSPPLPGKIGKIPEPKTRAWSSADLPAAPALRASSESSRIVPGEAGPPAATGTPESRGDAAPGVPRDAAPAPAPRVFAAPPSRLLRPLPYGREVVVDVTPEGREGAGGRIAAAARRLGGSVERIERDPSGVDVVAVRVLLPEPAAPAFLSEMDRIGKVPPEGKPAEVDIPAGPTRGTVAYTVRIRVR